MTIRTHEGSREVREWEGATPDSPVPPRVRLHVFRAKRGRCHKCGRKIGAADKWTCEHVTAIVNGRPGVNVNREANLDLTCSWCLPEKNEADAGIKSKTAAMAMQYLGIKPKKRKIPTHVDPWNKGWRAKLTDKGDQL